VKGELVQIRFDKILQTRAYTTIVVGNDEKRFAIYTEPSLGSTLQLALAGGEKPRPLTHDLASALLKGMKARLKQVVINQMREGVFFARLFVEQECGERRRIVEVDGRPSDGLTLALLEGAPIYCTREVLREAVPVAD